MDEKVTNKQHETALVLANAAELGAALIKRIAGNDISTAINGSVVTREMVQNLLIQKLRNRVLARAAK